MSFKIRWDGVAWVLLATLLLRLFGAPAWAAVAIGLLSWQLEVLNRA